MDRLEYLRELLHDRQQRERECDPKRGWSDDDFKPKSEHDEDMRILNLEKKRLKETGLTVKKTPKHLSFDTAFTREKTENLSQTRQDPNDDLIRECITASKGNIMQPTKSTSESLSTNDESKNVLPMVSPPQYEDLSQESWASLNLLKSTANELHNLMLSLNRVPESSSQSTRMVQLLDADRVKVAAECGKQIISTVRMQLDILKFAKELRGAK